MGHNKVRHGGTMFLSLQGCQGFTESAWESWEVTGVLRSHSIQLLPSQPGEAQKHFQWQELTTSISRAGLHLGLVHRWLKWLFVIQELSNLLHTRRFSDDSITLIHCTLSFPGKSSALYTYFFYCITKRSFLLPLTTKHQLIHSLILFTNKEIQTKPQEKVIEKWSYMSLILPALLLTVILRA